MRRKSEKELKKLEDDAILLRRWKAFHRKELEEALAGPHGQLITLLLAQLNKLDLNSGRALIDFIRRQDWSAVDARTRFIVLHEVNRAVTRLRERAGLESIDDNLPGQRENVFRTIRSIFEVSNPT